MLKMAIMGAGSIANKMADTITKMNDVKAYAIAARDTERAAAFAKNQVPIIKDDKRKGANLETIDKPIGDRHNSPIV